MRFRDRLSRIAGIVSKGVLRSAYDARGDPVPRARKMSRHRAALDGYILMMSTSSFTAAADF
jgi:hypothetical protein